ncbi:MAG: Fic family protein [Dehalococcoidia bacterium]|nr:Fic family protein [Dehalococcoidia bacterium]
MTTHPLKNSPCGKLVPVSNGQMAFVPAPLPRSIAVSNELVYKLDRASQAVAMLAGIGETIPNPHLLILPFVRREAILSSRIEGTQASLSDLFIHEASGRRQAKGDVNEVINYIAAMGHGIELLVKLPICVRLLNEIHLVLLQGVRGQEQHPGELRNEIVWIGSEHTPISEARYVPPPPDIVRDLMEDLERFANEELKLPPLIQCALLHYQFETIHPYLDGNGRIGRLLITLFLYWKGMLPKPLLYLSAYFERTRINYYDQLLNLSATGDWEAWLNYFFDGVYEQAQDAIRRIRRIREVQDKYKALLLEHHETANALRLVDGLMATSFTSVGTAARILGVTHAGASGILERLRAIGIVTKLENIWPRLYVASELLDAIDAPVS